MKKFNEICKEIIDISQEFDPEIRNVFEHHFVRFIKSLQTPKKNPFHQKLVSQNFDFDPNQEISGVDLDLVKKIKQQVKSLNENEIDINKQKMKQQAEEIKEKLKKG